MHATCNFSRGVKTGNRLIGHHIQCLRFHIDVYPTHAVMNFRHESHGIKGRLADGLRVFLNVAPPYLVFSLCHGFIVLLDFL